MAVNQLRRVSVQRSIPAPAEKIFAVLADPSVHWLIDGTESLRPVRNPAAARLQAGSIFITPMSRRPRSPARVHLMQATVALLVAGRMRNAVVEFDENRRIAWRNFGRHIWRYELEPVGEGDRTLVRETFDYAPSLAPWLLEWVGFPSHNATAMKETLERLDAVVSATTMTNHAQRRGHHGTA